VNNTQSRCDTF